MTEVIPVVAWVDAEERLPETSGTYLTAKRVAHEHGEFWMVEILPFSVRHGVFNARDWYESDLHSMEVHYWSEMPLMPDGSVYEDE